MYSNYDLYRTTSSAADAGVWTIVSLLLAICGGIVLYFTFLSPKNEGKYEGFLKKLYEFLSFKVMSLEVIMKILYLIIAIYITISSFSLISTSFVAFLLMLIVGNIVARIIFEGSLLILLIYRRINDIYNTLKNPKKKAERDNE